MSLTIEDHKTASESNGYGMGHTVSKDVTSNSSKQSLSSSVFLSEQFEVISTSDLNENMSNRPKPPGQKKLVKTWTLEIKSERQHLEGKHPELKPVLLGFKHCKDTLDNKKKRDERFYYEINVLLKEKIVGKFLMSEFSSDEQREVMGNKLVEIGFVEVALDYYKFILDEEDIEAVTNPLIREGKENENDHATKLIMTLREIFWNFSDSSFFFGEKLSETGEKSSETSLFQLLMVDLEFILQDTVEALQIEDDIFAFSSAVGILHNCARNPNIEKDKFRKVAAIEHLLPFLHSGIPYVKMITLLALANMIREDQVMLLDADIDVFDFVFDAINETWSDKTDRTKGYGFSLAELIDGLASLAQTEQNKKLIMEKEPLRLICTIMKESVVDMEKLSAIKFIWELAFLEENKEKIVKYTEMQRVLDTLKDHTDPDIKKTAMGAYFVLYEKDKIVHEPKHASAKKGSERRSSSIPKKEGKHIMISYQWSDQPMVLKIYEALKGEGYEVWIDIEHMSGYENLLEGMANAVENAYLVLICYSEKYKLSQNCRTEAEMVFTTQKDFMALKMQRDYKPDGWLLALIGARLFIEFSHKHPFEESIVKLIKQIRDRHIEPDDLRNESLTPGPAVYVEAIPGTVPVQEWTKQDVDSWMMKNKMTHKSFVKVKTLTGLQIGFLSKVYKRAPDTFFRWVEEKLLLKDLEDIRIFTAGIEGLGNP